MHPTLPAPFALHIPSDPVVLAVAVAVGWIVGPVLAARLGGVLQSTLRRSMLLLTIAALVGARLHYVLTHLDAVAGDPLQVLAFWDGGMHAGGGMVGLILAIPLVCARTGVTPLRFADLLVPTVALSLGITRIGCFLRGCCAGIPCEGPLCIAFPRESLLFLLHAQARLVGPGDSHTATVHPLQLYFSATAFGIALLALLLHRRRRYDGEVAIIALLAFALSSAALEFLRADYPGRVYWGTGPQLLWTAMALTGGAAMGLGLLEWRHRRRVRSTMPLQFPRSARVVS